MIKKIAILCDLNFSSGLGHLSRMKNLSNIFKKKNIKCFFLFNKKDKKLVNNYSKNLNLIFFSNQNQNKNIRKIINKNNFSIFIIDSYKKKFFLEKKLVNEGIFVVSIDDHLRDHFSNIVVTNRNLENNIIKKKKDQIWLSGNKYILVKKDFDKINKSNFKFKRKKLLLHAGGSNLYKNIKEFTISTLIAVDKYNLDASVLCTSVKAKNFIKKLLIKNNISSTIKFLPFIKNLSKKLKDYDLLAGPMGTTTLEAISSGVFPFSVPIKNDGRDPINSWYSFGHLAHLTHIEKKNKKILDQMWSLILNNYEDLLKLLKKNSKVIDGLGPNRLAEKILINFDNQNKKKNLNKTKIKKNNFLNFSKCKISNIRHLFNTRRNKISKDMNINKNIITWPKHINWWLNKDITNYKLEKEGYNIGYFWFETSKVNYKKYITSGYFLSGKKNYHDNLLSEILKIQFKILKKTYKDFTWIISIKKKNTDLIRISKKIGFCIASDESIFGVYNNLIKNDNFQIMEMKI